MRVVLGVQAINGALRGRSVERRQHSAFQISWNLPSSQVQQRGDEIDGAGRLVNINALGLPGFEDQQRGFDQRLV